jgi:hypothetical protein
MDRRSARGAARCGLGVTAVLALLVAAPGIVAAPASALRVKAAMPEPPMVGEPCRVVVEVGRRIGAKAFLQERRSGRWRTVDRGRLRRGSATLRCAASEHAGLRRFRVLIRRSGTTVGRSDVLRLRVAAAHPPSPLPAPPGPPVPPGPAPPPPIDPAQFGQEGTGGPPSAQTLALLVNPNVALSTAGQADLSAGLIDPRVVAVLARMADAHAIVVGPICSDHAKFDAGGTISNHYWGRAADITVVNGMAVGPANAAAHAAALSLASLPASIRPSEIGTPFVIAAPGFFTDAAHQDRVHVGFDEPIAPDWTPP